MSNYTIIGADGREYGPVSGEDLCKWIADGRANAGTQARIVGATEWKSLPDFPELAAALKGAVPPPLSPVGAPVTPAKPPKTSAMAVTSLVLGILGMFTCGLTALAGLILGIVAMVKVKNSGGKLGGGGLALAGTIVSGIFLVMLPIFAAMLLPALASAKQKAQEINCINNEKQLALAVRIYSSDNKDQFPPAATWCDAIKKMSGSDNIFRCPAANSVNPPSRCNYAFNAKLGGMDQSKVNPQTVMVFESDAGWNASGGPELLPAKARHRRGYYVVAFADGHVESVNSSRLNALRWDP